MPARAVYHAIRAQVQTYVGAGVRASTLERLTLLVLGMIEAEHASPARIARALHRLGVSAAQPESLERRIRRLQNDPQLSAALCFHPLAQAHLRLGKPPELYLLLDPTTQQEHIVLLTVAVCYRGSALPLAWVAWEGQTPLTDERFWARVAALLAEVAPLLPVGTRIIWLADRAFGTPAFTDLLAAYGWHYLVRVQGHTRTQDGQGRERPIAQWVARRGQRAKLRGRAFKKRGWRTVTVLVYWGRRHAAPLCLVTDLPARWAYLALYRRRFGIECLFRQYKRAGWSWEAGQVRDLVHVERLLVGMALATWCALLYGTARGRAYLRRAAKTPRRTRPEAGKLSLFRLGLEYLQCAMMHELPLDLWLRLEGWTAPPWQQQLLAHHAHAFLFARCSLFSDCEGAF